MRTLMVEKEHLLCPVCKSRWYIVTKYDVKVGKASVQCRDCGFRGVIRTVRGLIADILSNMHDDESG